MGNQASVEKKAQPRMEKKALPSVQTKAVPSVEREAAPSVEKKTVSSVKRKAVPPVEVTAVPPVETNQSPPPPPPPPAPSQLLPFCQYLLLRLKSDNLELLLRIVAEFLSHSPCFTTVDAMVRLAFPVIALLPVATDDPIKRAEAKGILSKMKELYVQTGQGDRGNFRDFSWTLRKAVELKNWDWLEQIYHEFCMGEEHCLMEFVRLQRQAIAIIPVAPMVSSHEPVRRSTEVPATSKVVTPQADEEECSKSPAAATTSPRKMRPPPVVRFDNMAVSTTGSNLSAEDMRARVYEVYRTVEKTEPWKNIFDVSKIEYPFDADLYPELAHKFKQFWEIHAHAVWERFRWPRLSSMQDNGKIERKWRQERASRLYESWVIVPIFRTLGAKFFVDLDKRPELHYWWWYRRSVVDLYELCWSHGEETAVQYLKSTATERFPKSPLDPSAEQQSEIAWDGWSMFSTKHKFKHICSAIAQAKEADARVGTRAY